MTKKYVVALDQGTTSSRAIVFDHQMKIVGISQREFNLYCPHDGWVEQDPMEILGTQYSVLEAVLAETGIQPEEIAAIGVTNQRETTILWDKQTGKPVFNAIVWQCRRTAPICDQLRAEGLEPYIKETTGLVLDAYFSGTKIKWILDNVPGVRQKAQAGDILFGTVDTWLVWNLTGRAVHVTDCTNASRTMLFDIKKMEWDEKILSALDIPKAILPKTADSSEVYGFARLPNAKGEKIEGPIAGIAGDQQAALFGQACFEPGDAKNTYGTGCFLLMNTGREAVSSRNGLLTTIAVRLGGQVEYALEGSVFVGGAVVQWLRDELKLIGDSADTAYFASKVPDNGGVYVVPAFVGLGAPYWDMYARGAILGLTRGASRNHIIRAALESIAYQTRDVLEAMMEDTGRKLTELKVDGGASRNPFLMQFQADLCGRSVVRPVVSETTALGAASLAGLAVGFWKSKEEIRELWAADARFEPSFSEEQRGACYKGWKKAVERTRDWARE